MIPFAANAGSNAAAKIAMLLNSPDNPRKLSLSFGGSGPPSNTWYPVPTQVIAPNGITIGSAVFVCVLNDYVVQCIVNGEENPKIAHCPWDFITPPEDTEPWR